MKPFKQNPKATWAALVLVPVFLLFFSICLGRYTIAPAKAFHVLASQIMSFSETRGGMEELIILNIRLPRILLAMLVGAGLAVAGAGFQGLFGNPLVSPHILGVTSGASFGAALGILVSGKIAVVQGLALGFGLLAVCLVYGASCFDSGSRLFVLVLSGIIVGALFTALLSLVKYVADPEEKLPGIVYWLMGSLSGSSYQTLLTGAPLILAGIGILLSIRWRINILSLSEEEAQSMGIHVQGLRVMVIMACSLITASAVSLCGVIGWVGLVIPHMGRMLVGPDHRILLPACVSMGAAYLLFIDDIARAATGAEIPLSILSAVIGAPFFYYLLRKTGGGWK